MNLPQEGLDPRRVLSGVGGGVLDSNSKEIYSQL